MISRRYAAALLASATEKGKQAKVKEDLEGFVALINSSEDLQRALKSKIIAKGELANAVSEILAKANADEVSKNFAKVVVENGRGAFFGNIIAAYKEQFLEAEGEVTAVVTTAVPLSSNHAAEIANALKKTSEKKIHIEERVDPKILGGVVIRLGSKMIDNSVAGKLEKLKIAQKKTLVG